MNHFGRKNFLKNFSQKIPNGGFFRTPCIFNKSILIRFSLLTCPACSALTKLVRRFKTLLTNCCFGVNVLGSLLLWYYYFGIVVIFITCLLLALSLVCIAYFAVCFVFLVLLSDLGCNSLVALYF